jgi:hypothetical protein
MKRAFPIKAALVLTAGLLTAGCGKVDCTLAENMAKDECKAAGPDWGTVQAALVAGSCASLAACHGAGTPAAPNRLKIDVAAGKEKANCQSVTAAANMLINKSNPAASRLVVFPSDKTAMPAHTGGTTLSGWMSATDTSSKKVIDWVTAGAACP